MERKLIANHLVPDDEVWVSPETWERPFSLKAKESTVTDTQRLKAEIATLLKVWDNQTNAKNSVALTMSINRLRQLSAV